jgi:hypothetical protein
MHTVRCFNVLRAYEISTFHKREPPPKEILEDVSAKGGDLLNRTLENYTVRAIREADNLGGGSQEGGSDDEHKTPNASEKMDVDEPGSTGGRVTRGRLSKGDKGPVLSAAVNYLGTWKPNLSGFTAAEGLDTLPKIAENSGWTIPSPDLHILLLHQLYANNFFQAYDRRHHSESCSAHNKTAADRHHDP